MTKKKKLVPISYTSRDFESIKGDLVEYAKKYYSSNYQDFNEASFGSLVLDSVAYVGDILSYYLDYSVNETFLDSAIEYDNVIRLARNMGYNFKGSPTSFGTATFFVLVPANSTGLGPDRNYMPVLKRGSSFSTPSGNKFLLNEDVHFSNSSNEIVVARVAADTGIPTYYAVRAVGQIISGENSRETVVVGSYQRFFRAELDANDISEIVSVLDSEGHEYFEVEHLSQNIIYRPIVNRKSSTRDQVSSILKPFVVPRRFTVERERQKTFIQFGYGSDSELQDSSVADPTNVVLDVFGKDYITDETLDPSKLLETDKFGVAPANTSLSIIYRKNSLDNANAAAGTVTSVVSPIIKFDDVTSLDPRETAAVRGSLEITNEDPIHGDVSLPNSEEIKKRAMGYFMTQARAVTALDYKTLAYNMPPKFGSIKRVSVGRDTGDFKNNINMYVISEDSRGALVQANDDLKNNLIVWLSRNKMISDTIDILDAKIINYGIVFSVLVRPDSNKFDVLSSCIETLAEELGDKKDIGENISISEVYSFLNRVDGVQDAISVEIVLKEGGVYSSTRINLDDLMTSDGREIECPGNCIFELKFADLDIKGVTK